MDLCPEAASGDELNQERRLFVCVPGGERLGLRLPPGLFYLRAPYAMITIPNMADVTPRPCPVCGEVINIADHEAALAHAVKDDEHKERLFRTPPSQPDSSSLEGGDQRHETPVP